MKALPEEDAWSLFKNIAGDDPTLKSTAEMIVKKCGGVPIAIVTMAKALKFANKDHWDVALNCLKTEL